MVYLDYASSTKVDSEVLDLYYNLNKKYFANANSNHRLGLEVKKIIDDSTNNISKLLKVKPSEIIYTSSATESNNLAIFGIANRYKNFGKHIIISKLEHNSITKPCEILQKEGFIIDTISVNKDGLIDIDELKNMIRDDTILVSITSVDSELGIRQPIEDIAKLLKNYPNIHFHSDASQSIGKINIDYSNVDLVTIDIHKFGGLNSSSILIKKENTSLVPIIYGGRSTTIYRAGTPDMPLIASSSLALTKALNNLDKNYKYVLNLNKYIINKLKNYNNIIINSTNNSIPYIINFSIKNINSTYLLNKLSLNNIYVSNKTSCCPVNGPSKLVYALTNDKKISTSSIRLSISSYSSKEDIDKFFLVLDKIIEGEKNGEI